VKLQELASVAFRLASTDNEMLKIIAEYRIITSPQLAALLSRSKKGVRDRISKLIAVKKPIGVEDNTGVGPSE
jgi:predicted HTH transcriptional regulator